MWPIWMMCSTTFDVPNSAIQQHRQRYLFFLSFKVGHHANSSFGSDAYRIMDSVRTVNFHYCIEHVVLGWILLSIVILSPNAIHVSRRRMYNIIIAFDYVYLLPAHLLAWLLFNVVESIELTHFKVYLCAFFCTLEWLQHKQYYGSLRTRSIEQSFNSLFSCVHRAINLLTYRLQYTI